jgi:molybdopterin converting factor small subunit
MKIFVKLFSNFAFYHSPSTFHWEVKEGASVMDVLQDLKIPENLPRLALINGQVVTDRTVLTDGDTLSFFSPVAGG